MCACVYKFKRFQYPLLQSNFMQITLYIAYLLCRRETLTMYLKILLHNFIAHFMAQFYIC